MRQNAKAALAVASLFASVWAGLAIACSIVTGVAVIWPWAGMV